MAELPNGPYLNILRNLSISRICLDVLYSDILTLISVFFLIKTDTSRCPIAYPLFSYLFLLREKSLFELQVVAAISDKESATRAIYGGIEGPLINTLICSFFLIVIPCIHLTFTSIIPDILHLIDNNIGNT